MTTPPESAGPAGETGLTEERVPRRRRPHPQIDQMKRTWYFFRRNTLAFVGFGILVMIVAVAAYAAALPLSWTSTPIWCSTDYGPSNPVFSGYPGNFTQDCALPEVCTYEVHPPPNAAEFCGGLWYPIPVRSGNAFAGIVSPTLTLSPYQLGPLPLGALTISSGDRTPLYDVSSMLLRGSDWTLIFSTGIVGLGAIIGLLVGTTAGFYGGLLDEALMRLVDIFLSIPTILFVIVLVAVLSLLIPTSGGNAYALRLFLMVMGFVLVWWPFYARITRGQVLTVREQKYVEAARASGASGKRILLRHIIPNSLYPVMIQFSLDVGTIPLLVGGLVYLGFAPLLFPTSPFPEWGSISAISVSDLQSDFMISCWTPADHGCIIPWWQLVYPGIALFLFAISVNLLSDGLRDALDPRLRR